MVGGSSGGQNSIGKNDVEEKGRTLTKGSCSWRHMIIVPPILLEHLRGRSGSAKSMEFKEELYDDLKSSV